MGKKKVSTEENICFNCVSRVGKKLFNGKKRDVPTVFQGREKKKEERMFQGCGRIPFRRKKNEMFHRCFYGEEKRLFNGEKKRMFRRKKWIFQRCV